MEKLAVNKFKLALLLLLIPISFINGADEGSAGTAASSSVATGLVKFDDFVVLVDQLEAISDNKVAFLEKKAEIKVAMDANDGYGYNNVSFLIYLMHKVFDFDYSDIVTIPINEKSGFVKIVLETDFNTGSFSKLNRLAKLSLLNESGKISNKNFIKKISEALSDDKDSYNNVAILLNLLHLLVKYEFKDLVKTNLENKQELLYSYLRLVLSGATHTEARAKMPKLQLATAGTSIEILIEKYAKEEVQEYLAKSQDKQLPDEVAAIAEAIRLASINEKIYKEGYTATAQYLAEIDFTSIEARARKEHQKLIKGLSHAKASAVAKAIQKTSTKKQAKAHSGAGAGAAAGAGHAVEPEATKSAEAIIPTTDTTEATSKLSKREQVESILNKKTIEKINSLCDNDIDLYIFYNLTHYLLIRRKISKDIFEKHILESNVPDIKYLNILTLDKEFTPGNIKKYLPIRLPEVFRFINNKKETTDDRMPLYEAAFFFLIDLSADKETILNAIKKLADSTDIESDIDKLTEKIDPVLFKKMEIERKKFEAKAIEEKEAEALKTEIEKNELLLANKIINYFANKYPSHVNKIRDYEQEKIRKQILRIVKAAIRNKKISIKDFLNSSEKRNKILEPAFNKTVSDVDRYDTYY